MTSTFVMPAHHLVATAFAERYYQALHSTPAVVGMFYSNSAEFLRCSSAAVTNSGAEPASPEAETRLVGQATIVEYFQKHGGEPESTKVHVQFLDSQNVESDPHRVIVLAYGTFSSQAHGNRSFVQTFVLRWVSETGAFEVCNDVLRYIGTSKTSKPVAATAASADAKANAPISQKGKNANKKNQAAESVPAAVVSADSLSSPHAPAQAESKSSDAAVVAAPVQSSVEPAKPKAPVKPIGPGKKSAAAQAPAAPAAPVVVQPVELQVAAPPQPIRRPTPAQRSDVVIPEAPVPAPAPVEVKTEKKPAVQTADKKPVAPAVEKKPVAQAAEKKPIAHAAEKKPAVQAAPIAPVAPAAVAAKAVVPLSEPIGLWVGRLPAATTVAQLRSMIVQANSDDADVKNSIVKVEIVPPVGESDKKGFSIGVAYFSNVFAAERVLARKVSLPGGAIELPLELVRDPKRQSKMLSQHQQQRPPKSQPAAAAPAAVAAPPSEVPVLPASSLLKPMPIVPPKVQAAAAPDVAKPAPAPSQSVQQPAVSAQPTKQQPQQNQQKPKKEREAKRAADPPVAAQPVSEQPAVSGSKPVQQAKPAKQSPPVAQSTSPQQAAAAPVAQPASTSAPAREQRPPKQKNNKPATDAAAVAPVPSQPATQAAAPQVKAKKQKPVQQPQPQVQAPAVAAPVAVAEPVAAKQKKPRSDKQAAVPAVVPEVKSSSAPVAAAPEATQNRQQQPKQPKQPKQPRAQTDAKPAEVKAAAQPAPAPAPAPAIVAAVASAVQAPAEQREQKNRRRDNKKTSEVPSATSATAATAAAPAVVAPAVPPVQTKPAQEQAARPPKAKQPKAEAKRKPVAAAPAAHMVGKKAASAVPVASSLPAPVDAPGRWVPRAEFRGTKSFGFYFCASCDRNWMSAYAWKDFAQDCKGCEHPEYPLYMWQNSSKKEPNLSSHDDETEKPHDKERCAKCRFLGRGCWIVTAAAY